MLGMYHSLVESRVPFELVHEAFLTPDRLRSVQAADPGRRRGAVGRAVRRHPRLRRRAAAACWRRSPRRSSTRAARRRADFGLADRVRRVLRRPRRRPDAELLPEPRRGPRRPPARGAGRVSSDTAADHQRRLSTRRAPFGASFRRRSRSSRPIRICRWRTSIRACHTPRHASCTSAISGRSRVVYLPWDIDRTFWDVMCVDHLRLLQNTIRWATNEPPPAVVEGPGLIDVTVWRQRDVDDRAPRQPHQPDDDERAAARIIPVGPQRVSVRLPAGSVRPECSAADRRQPASGRAHVRSVDAHRTGNRGP